MTTLVDEPVEQSPPVHPRVRKDARWRISWMFALRMALREVRRSRGRSLLMIVLIALPVTSVAVSVVALETSQRAPLASAVASLGSADAMVSPTGFDAPTTQDMWGYPLRGNRRAESRNRNNYEHIIESLPPDWRVLPVWPGRATVTSSSRRERIPMAVLDLADPVTEGLLVPEAGQSPERPGEVFLDASVAEDLGVGPGDRVAVGVNEVAGEPSLLKAATTYTQSTVTIAGVGRILWRGQLYMAPKMVAMPDTVTGSGYFPAAPLDPVSVLVDSPNPITLADIQALNRVGLVVASRDMLVNPPVGCTEFGRCPPAEDARPTQRGEAVEFDTTSKTAEMAALTALALVIVLLQIALLAGPAFAVSLRRRQRELGLLAANGATPSDLRRQMFGLGLIIGVLGGLLGTGLGYVLVLGYFLRPGHLITAADPIPLPSAWSVLLTVVAAVVCATAAAVLPAVIAGRTSVAVALRGHQKGTAKPLRLPLVGLATAVFGLVLVFIGTNNWWPLALALGFLLWQLGLLGVTPSVIAATARMGRVLPLGGRMASRDLNRSRLRSTTAIAAVTAASIAAITGLVVLGSVRASDEARTVPGSAHGLISVSVKPQDAPAVIEAMEQVWPGSQPHLKRVLDSRSRGYYHYYAVPVRPCSISAQDRAILNPGMLRSEGDSGPSQQMVDVALARALADPSCHAPRSAGNDTDAAVLTGPQLRAIIGSDDRRIDSVLNRGGAITFTPGRLSADGTLTIEVNAWRRNPRYSVTVPGMALTDGPAPAALVVGPRFEAAALGSRASVGNQVVAAPRQVPDEAEITRLDALVAGNAFLDRPAPGSARLTMPNGQPPDDPTSKLAVLAVAVLAGIAVAAGLVVTALAVADARPDLATSAAVGAAPRFRRSFSAWSAGLITGLGVLLGLAGSIPAVWAVLRLYQAVTNVALGNGALAPVRTPTSLSIPLLPVLGLVIAVPVAAALAAWLCTRSKVDLTRRAVE
ncbi:MAG: FtsX-like permease family protein [Candidatus Nanopelagicales bacterium]|nr:FtsX-like permease family protein [Candidatus Nanopelagicales bacterium]